MGPTLPEIAKKASVNYDTIVNVKREKDVGRNTVVIITYESVIVKILLEKPILIEFLDKFCVNKDLERKTFWTFDNWRIEYGFLMTAYQWSKENPDEFEKAVKKAENKKEFKILLGVR